MPRCRLILILAVLVLAPATAFAQKGGGGGGGGGGRGGGGNPIDGGSSAIPSMPSQMDDAERDTRLREDPLNEQKLRELDNVHWRPVAITAIHGRQDSVEVTTLDRALHNRRYLRLHRGDTTVVWINAPSPQTQLQITALGPEAGKDAKAKGYALAALIDGLEARKFMIKSGRDVAFRLPDSTETRAKKPQRFNLDVPYGRHKVTLVVTEGPGEYVLADLKAWQLVQRTPQP